MKINSARLINTFQSLVKIDSPSFGERQMADDLKLKLESLGLSVFEDNAGRLIGGNCGNVFAVLEETAKGEAVLFSAHMDTVEPSKGKEAVINPDGKITSLGATVLGADDLAGVSAILEALETIKENNIPHPRIEILFTVAEEVYCKGVEVFDFNKITSKTAFVLDLAGDIGDASYKAPTVVKLLIDIKGRAAHAGFAPEKGAHALQAAAKAVSMIHMGRIDEETLQNIGVISGGTATNIVPDFCHIEGEVRSFSHEKALHQAAQIRTIFESCAKEAGAEALVDIILGCRAYETSLDSEAVKRFEKAAASVGIKPNYVKTFGGSDYNHMSTKGITGLVLASAMFGCHSTDEYTTVKDLEKTAEITLALMKQSF